MEYIKTEKELNAPAPVRLFSLEGLGIPQEELLNDLRKLSILLEWDEYDVKQRQLHFLAEKFPEATTILQRFTPEYYSGKASLGNLLQMIERLSVDELFNLEMMRPRRKRSIARFLLSTKTDRTNIIRIPSQIYRQNVGPSDVRQIERRFKEMSDLITDNPLVIKFVLAAKDMVEEVQGKSEVLECTLHRMYAVGDIMQPGDNAPEGAHQDGADYIISALVISRHGVTGAESVVCDESGDKIYLRHTLQPGEGIFQADSGSPLWHDVTPIEYDTETPAFDGFRDIIGLDIKIRQ